MSFFIGNTMFRCTNSFAVDFPIFLAMSASTFATFGMSTFFEGFFLRCCWIVLLSYGAHFWIWIDFWISEAFDEDLSPQVTFPNQSNPRIPHLLFPCSSRLCSVKTNICKLVFTLYFWKETES